MVKLISDLERNYKIDFNRIISEIKNRRAKMVLLQFPDGLKPYSISVVDFLKGKCKNVEFLIWFGSCFGACDTPVLPSEIEKKIDLIVQIGHNEMRPNY